MDKDFREKIKSSNCCVCSHPGSEHNPMTPSHIKSRGAGGDDSEFNVVPMCLMCHIDFENNKVSFTKRHPHVHGRLKRLGWKIETILGKECLMWEQPK